MSLAGGTPAPQPANTAADARASISSWGSSIGSFISQRTSRLSVPRPESAASESSITSISAPASIINSEDPTSPTGPPRAAPVTTSASDDPPAVRPSPTPISSVFSSWSFGRASPTKAPSPALEPSPPKPEKIDPFVATKAGSAPVSPAEDLELPPEFQPRNLDEVPSAPSSEPRSPTLSSSAQSISTSSSTSFVQPGMAI